MRTDYLDRDDEGHQMFISVHGNLDAANEAAKEHVKKHSSGHNLNDANTNNYTAKDGTTRTVVMVREDDYHSFEVEVFKEPLLHGHVVPDSSATKRGADEVEKGEETEEKPQKAAKTRSKA